MYFFYKTIFFFFQKKKIFLTFVDISNKNDLLNFWMFFNLFIFSFLKPFVFVLTSLFFFTLLCFFFFYPWVLHPSLGFVCPSFGCLFTLPLGFCLPFLWVFVCPSFGFLFALPLGFCLPFLWVFVCPSFGFGSPFLHVRFTLPSCSVHPSFMFGSPFLHVRFTLPSCSVHPSFMFGSPFLHVRFTLPSCSVHPLVCLNPFVCLAFCFCLLGFIRSPWSIINRIWHTGEMSLSIRSSRSRVWISLTEGEEDDEE